MEIIGNNEIILGVNNKFIKILLRYPWHSFFVAFITTLLIIFSISDIIYALRFIIIVLPICLTLILLASIYHKNSCYKLIINNISNEVHFYLMFNRGVFVEDSHDLRIEIGREIMVFSKDRNYKILSEILHDAVSYLPPDTKIMFKGFFGKQFKKELEKNKPLTPGRHFKA